MNELEKNKADFEIELKKIAAKIDHALTIIRLEILALQQYKNDLNKLAK